MKRVNRRKLNSTGNEPCDICRRETFLEQHHIRGRKIYKPNHSNNLANICADCHLKVHHGIIVIEGWYMTTDGYKLVWHHYKESSLTGDDAKPWVM